MPISRRTQGTTAEEGSLCDTSDGEFHLHGTGAVAELEKRLCELFTMQHALGVPSGTFGLLAAALAMELSGREVIVPALAHGASFAGLLHIGARLHFVDIDRDTLTIDVHAARRALTRRTAAVLAVDLFGIPSDGRALRAFATENRILYLADVAQAFGASRDQQPAGCRADAAVVSFTAGKFPSAGEGGAVLTNRRDIYDRLVWLTQHPYRQRRELGLHLVNPFSLNGRMHPAGATYACANLESAASSMNRRRLAAVRLANVIAESKAGVCLPAETSGIEAALFRVPIRLAPGWSAERLHDLVRASGIEAVDDPPLSAIYRHPVLRAAHRGRFRVPRPCPNADAAVDRVVPFRVAP